MALRSKLVTILLFLSITAFGQSAFNGPSGLWLHNNGPWPADSLSNQVEAYSRLHLGSNAITANLLNRFLTSGFIDETVKSSAEERLKDSRNTLYLDWRNGVRYQHNIRKEGDYQGSWWLGFENRQDIVGWFNKGMYQLALYGNARFEGTDVQIEAGQINSYQSNRLTAGYQRVFRGEKVTSTFGGSVSLIDAYDFAGVDQIGGNIYTADRGEFLAIDVSGSFMSSDTLSRGAFNFEGLGFDISLGWDAYYPESDWRFGLQAGTRDVIQWNSESFTVSGQFKDTLRGVDLTQKTLSELSVPTDAASIGDLLNLERTQGAESLTRYWFSTYLGKQISERLNLLAYFRFQPTLNHSMIQIHAEWHVPNHWLTLGGSAHYDTFRGYNLGLRALGRFGKWQAVLSSDDVFGWLLPGSFTGVSYHARLGYSF